MAYRLNNSWSSAHAWFGQIQPSGKYRQDKTFINLCKGFTTAFREKINHIFLVWAEFWWARLIIDQEIKFLVWRFYRDPIIYRTIILAYLYRSKSGRKFVGNGRKSADWQAKTMPDSHNILFIIDRQSFLYFSCEEDNYIALSEKQSWIDVEFLHTLRFSHFPHRLEEGTSSRILWWFENKTVRGGTLVVPPWYPLLISHIFPWECILSRLVHCKFYPYLPVWYWALTVRSCNIRREAM